MKIEGSKTWSLIPLLFSGVLDTTHVLLIWCVYPTGKYSLSEVGQVRYMKKYRDFQLQI